MIQCKECKQEIDANEECVALDYDLFAHTHCVKEEDMQLEDE